MSLYPRSRQQSRDRIEANRPAPAYQVDFEPWAAIEAQAGKLSPQGYISFWRGWLSMMVPMSMLDMPSLPPEMQANYDLANLRIRYWSTKL